MVGHVYLFELGWDGVRHGVLNIKYLIPVNAFVALTLAEEDLMVVFFYLANNTALYQN